MDKLKQWVALTMVGVIAIAAAGWFLLISPKRSEAADLRTQAAQQVSANNALETQIQVLKSQAKELPQQQAKLAAVAAKIPDNPAQPALIRALTAAADDTGVELVSLAPGQPTAVAPPVAAVPVTAAPASGAPNGTPATGAAVPVAASAGTLQSIAVTLNVVGGYFQIEQFLDRVESLSRAMKVTAFTLAPGANPLKPAAAQAGLEAGSTLTAAITGTVYMASGRSTAAAAAGAVGK